MDGLRSLSQGASTSVRYAQHEPRRKDCGHVGSAGEQHSLHGDEGAGFFACVFALSAVRDAGMGLR